MASSQKLTAADRLMNNVRIEELKIMQTDVSTFKNDTFI